MERVTNSRNFVNKVWNGGKFILFNLKVITGYQGPSPGPLLPGASGG